MPMPAAVQVSKYSRNLEPNAIFFMNNTNSIFVKYFVRFRGNYRYIPSTSHDRLMKSRRVTDFKCHESQSITQKQESGRATQATIFAAASECCNTTKVCLDWGSDESEKDGKEAAWAWLGRDAYLPNPRGATFNKLSVLYWLCRLPVQKRCTSWNDLCAIR